MPEVQADARGQSYVEFPNGFAPGQSIRITLVDRTEEDVGYVIRIQRHIEGRAPDPGPEMTVPNALFLMEGVLCLLREEGHGIQ